MWDLEVSSKSRYMEEINHCLCNEDEEGAFIKSSIKQLLKKNL